MRFETHARAFLSRLSGPLAARAILLLIGFAIIVQAAEVAQGGNDLLWRYNRDDRHRITAMAMLHGTLRLRNGVATMVGDEQVYNGATYTNWGFGVPLMQLPFHAVARNFEHFPGGFFPDRAIFFIYLTALVPLLWVAFGHLLAMRRPWPRDWFRLDLLSGAAVLFVITFALFPLMSGRFIVYEETICYLILVELVALSAYIFSFETRTLWPIVVMGAAAGMGLVIRATGLIYMGVWGVLVLLERRTWRSVVAFGVTTIPFVAFWLYSNWVKAGSPFDFGYANSMPGFPWHTPMVRFNRYPCSLTLRGTLDTAERLARWFYVSTSDDPGESALNARLSQCHFNPEVRPPANSSEPFFGLSYLVFVLGTLAHHLLVRRERRLAVYVPYATYFVMFYAFAKGPGFAWRYAGDFWPCMAMMGVNYVRYLPASMEARFSIRVAAIMGLLCAVSMCKDIETATRTIDTLDDASAKRLSSDFERSFAFTDPPLASQLTCGHVPRWPHHNGHGWDSNCRVDTFTNFFLGVPEKDRPFYQVRFEAEGVNEPTLRLYLNGRIYTARREGDRYVARVNVDYGQLHTPTVMGTIEWTQDLDPKPYKLMSVEII